MTLGEMARRLLGPRLFPLAGRAYRSFFVDLDRVVQAFPPMAPGSHVLEVGAGDGELMNALLTRNPEVRATMIDISPRVGTSLRDDLRARVDVFPGTSLKEYNGLGRPAPDLVLISDVLHHIPAVQRAAFFHDVNDLVRGHRCSIVVKDIRPGLVRARLSYLADRYISGDANVNLIGEDELEALIRDTVPGATPQRTRLIEDDPPNYCVVFSVGG